MANHCIEVICHTCGTQWCARGCSNGEILPDKQLALEQSKIQGKVKFDEICPYCGSNKDVYYYHNTNNLQ